MLGQVYTFLGNDICIVLFSLQYIKLDSLTFTLRGSLVPRCREPGYLRESLKLVDLIIPSQELAAKKEELQAAIRKEVELIEQFKVFSADYYAFSLIPRLLANFMLSNFNCRRS